MTRRSVLRSYSTAAAIVIPAVFLGFGIVYAVMQAPDGRLGLHIWELSAPVAFVAGLCSLPAAIIRRYLGDHESAYRWMRCSARAFFVSSILLWMVYGASIH